MTLVLKIIVDFFHIRKRYWMTAQWDHDDDTKPLDSYCRIGFQHILVHVWLGFPINYLDFGQIWYLLPVFIPVQFRKALVAWLWKICLTVIQQSYFLNLHQKKFPSIISGWRWHRCRLWAWLPSIPWRSLPLRRHLRSRQTGGRHGEIPGSVRSRICPLPTATRSRQGFIQEVPF